jgi:CheY-like chemotaxis protein
MPDAKRIFIADDDEAALFSLQKLLVLSGFEVAATKNSKDAVSKIKSFKPHIILLDLIMPVLGGLEICDILNRDSQAQGIPIIIISALGGYTDIKKAYQLGVVGYFTKPYEFPELLQEIHKAIASKEGQA